MRVRDVMSPEVESALRSMPASSAWQKLRHAGYRHLVVQDGEQVVGVISDGDLGGTRGAELRRGRTVGDLMTPAPFTVTPSTTLQRAAALLRGHSIGCLPVLSGSRVVGVVTLSDVLDRVGRMPAPRPRFKPTRRTAHTPRVAMR